jgi:hypothetical protein
VAITRVAHGTVATGVNPVPGEPAGIASGDLLLCFCKTGSATAVAPTMTAAWKAAGSADGNGAAGNLVFGRLFTFPYAGSSPDYTVTANAAGWAVVVAYRPSTGGVISVDQTVGHGTSISNSATVNYDSLTPVGVDEMRVWAWFTAGAALTNGAISGTLPTPTEQLDTDEGYADGFQSEAIATGARTSTLSASTTQSGMTVLLMESLPPTLPSVNLPPTMRGGF